MIEKGQNLKKIKRDAGGGGGWGGNSEKKTKKSSTRTKRDEWFYSKRPEG